MLKWGRLPEGQSRNGCWLCQFDLFACLQTVVNYVYTTAASAGIPLIPTARVVSFGPAISSSACSSRPILCSPSAAPQLFCCEEPSRLPPETMAWIWIIKGVRHYDTVSPCRGGQHTNIQAHTIFPLYITPFLVPALNKLQAWVGPWMSQAGLERSSLVNVTSAIGVSEKSLLGLTNTCSFWHAARMKVGSFTFSIVESVHNDTLT